MVRVGEEGWKWSILCTQRVCMHLYVEETVQFYFTPTYLWRTKLSTGDERAHQPARRCASNDIIMGACPEHFMEAFIPSPCTCTCWCTVIMHIQHEHACWWMCMVNMDCNVWKCKTMPLITCCKKLFLFFTQTPPPPLPKYVGLGLLLCI